MPDSSLATLSDSLLFSVKRLSVLPDHPGVYCFYNQSKDILYIGKAKNLRKRVQSYFQRRDHKQRPAKLRRMIESTHYVSFTAVPAEHDALLLENNWIKHHQPPYNVLLKDDKSFPYLCLTKEPFPRLVITRRYNRRMGEYFGPYTDSGLLRHLVRFVHDMYPLRSCRWDLAADKVRKGHYQVCLEYHMKRCKGPCEGKQTEADYATDIARVRALLKGSFSGARQYFLKEMEQAAEHYAYERAAYFKEKLRLLAQFQSKSIVVSPRLKQLDVCTLTQHDTTTYVNYLCVENGRIVLSDTIRALNAMDEDPNQLFRLCYTYLAEKHHRSLASTKSPKEVLTNVSIRSWSKRLRVRCPRLGDKRKLVALSLQNSQLVCSRMENKKTIASEELLQLTKEALKLKHLPTTIHAFDISNTQYESVVAASICFHKAKPLKRAYRQFIIRSLSHRHDDVASMYEAVLRHGRHWKASTDNKVLFPNLVVIDGGRAQLNAALRALKELHLDTKMDVIALAKRFEEFYLPNRRLPLRLSKRDHAFRFLQRIRNETHRFVLKFHRVKRSQNALASQMDAIKGIGKATKDKLLKAYDTIESMQQASLQSLTQSIGAHKANLIYQHFHTKD